MLHLVVLDLWQCRRMTHAGIHHTVGIPTLRKLICFGCNKLTYKTLQNLSARPFPIEYLEISYCYWINKNLTSIGSGPSLLALTTLPIIGTRITDRRLSYVAEKLTRLAFLDLSACKVITEESIGALATHLTGLWVLVI
ncbi:hypothetical protein HPB48_026453 [Haemaphysalis longicornis]|uniref:F-box/LRR-repeat protein 15-like leucin rich repeat domain-containing protein n=1 Tax=Haemaphysalis longicornis TaxID=44386 RepID=A0A9J6H9K6_HAELO|nr:hypothetical protein HPB48_026453 [Haemaphysalis longicornis]